MNIELATRVRDLLPASAADLPGGVDALAVLRLVREVMGEDLAVFPDGRMLIWHIARHDGYDIPPYPMAGCGDVREFLCDEGVRDVPGWYERHLGMDRQAYDQIWRHELVMVRNRTCWRKVFQVPSSQMHPGAGEGNELLLRLREWLDFALGTSDDRDDPSLFRR